MAIDKVQVSAKRGKKTKKILALEDPVFTPNLITHKLAHHLNMTSEQVAIKVMAPKEQHGPGHARVYSFSLTDSKGANHEVSAIGVDTITSMAEADRVKDLVMLFQEATRQAKQAFVRPHGTLNVLLGMASRSLHCKDGLEAGQLRMNRTLFF